jgi:hypothetical protein
MENSNDIIKFARKCSHTGKGMNKGYVVNDGDLYFKKKKHLLKWLRGQDFVTSDGENPNNFADADLLEWAYSDEVYYWTSWEDDQSDWYYQFKDDVLIELETI